MQSSKIEIATLLLILFLQAYLAILISVLFLYAIPKAIQDEKDVIFDEIETFVNGTMGAFQKWFEGIKVHVAL